jgi:hypothetical protein
MRTKRFVHAPEALRSQSDTHDRLARARVQEGDERGPALVPQARAILAQGAR